MSVSSLSSSPAAKGLSKHIASQGVYDASHGVLSWEHIAASVSKYGWAAFKNASKAVWKDKLFVTFLGLSVAGFGYVGVREYMRLKEFQAKTRLAMKAREASIKRAMERKTPSSTDVIPMDAEITAMEKAAVKAAPKRQKAKTMSLFAMLRRLMAVVVPSPTSYTAQLMVVQFFLLVMRTFLTINCVKAAITAITRAISKASFKSWVGWLAQFTLWMSGGIVVNTGLHFFQSLIALNIRKELTKHAHERYLKNMNFYRVCNMSKPAVPVSDITSSITSPAPSPVPTDKDTTKVTDDKAKTAVTPFTPSSPPAAPVRHLRLDNIEQRIARDIQVFSDNIAFLYGHSFKPVLEFIMSLAEASRDLGIKRPMALFAVSTLINVVCKTMTPHLGRMVSKEAELEGDFQQAHNRIVSHSEEIAFMDGGETERSIVNHKLDEVITTKTFHTLQRIKKSIADNFIKFSGMLVGGVFVHVPFLLATNLAADQRISQFRATEEIMMRCGTSFSELILLNRELQELSGYAGRIVDLFDALDAVEVEESNKQEEKGHLMVEAHIPEGSLITTDVDCSAQDKKKKLFGGLTSASSRKGSMHTLTTEMNDAPLEVDVQHGVFPSSMHLKNPKDVAGHLDALQRGEQPETISPKESFAASHASADGSVIVFNDVTVVAPEEYPNYISWRTQQQYNLTQGNTETEPFSGRLLIDNLNLTIPQGKSVLVTGPNGAGKTSLFRTLAGLWSLASGTIIKPHSDDGALMLLPQKPYMVSGSLRDQITYPHIYKLRVKGRSNFDVKNIKFVCEEELRRIDEAILRVCVQAGVDNVVENQAEGLDAIAAWESKLSGGERQKVVIARVLYHKPLFVVLDEATAAMHEASELKIYSSVIAAGLTLFSIGHRPHLRVFHDWQLDLDGQGGWKLIDLAANRTEEELARLKELAGNVIHPKK